MNKVMTDIISLRFCKTAVSKVENEPSRLTLTVSSPVDSKTQRKVSFKCVARKPQTHLWIKKARCSISVNARKP